VAARKKKNPSVLFDRRSLPSVPAIAPGWDAFCYFFRILSGAWRRMAHSSVLAAGQVGVKRQIDHGRRIEPALGRPDVGEVSNPLLVRPGGCKLPIQNVHGSDLAIAFVLRQTSAPWPRPQGLGRINRSIRCRPHSTPSASRSRQTRRAPSLARKLAFTCWPTVSSLRDLTLSQAWKPDRDTPNASHSHATGQIFRCFAMKTNFMSLPSQSRPRPFLGYPLSLQLVDLALEPLDLQLLGLHLPMAREGLNRIGADLLPHLRRTFS
jgi:hypothetical protein